MDRRRRSAANIADLMFTEAPSENEAIRDAIEQGPGRGPVTTKPGARTSSTVLMHSSVSPVRRTRRDRRRRHRLERRLRAPLAGRDGAPRRGAPASAFATARMGAWSWDATTDVVTWDEHMEARYGLSPGAFGGTFDEYCLARPSRRS